MRGFSTRAYRLREARLILAIVLGFAPLSCTGDSSNSSLDPPSEDSFYVYGTDEASRLESSGTFYVIPESRAGWCVRCPVQIGFPMWNDVSSEFRLELSQVEYVRVSFGGSDLSIGPLRLAGGQEMLSGVVEATQGLSMHIEASPDTLFDRKRIYRLTVRLDVVGNSLPPGLHQLKMEFTKRGTDDKYPLEINTGSYLPATSAVFGSKNDVWMGTASRGIIRVPMPEFGRLDWSARMERTMLELLQGRGRHGLPEFDESVTVLARGPQGSVWLGGMVGWYAVLDPEGQVLFRGGAGSLLYTIASVKLNDDGLALVSGFNQGVTVLEYGERLDIPADDVKSGVGHPTDPDIIDADWGPDGTIWAASTDLDKDPAGGVDGFVAIRLAREETKLVAAETQSFRPNYTPLRTDLLTRIAVDSKGIVWVGSDLGLIVLDPGGTPFMIEDDRWSEVTPSNYIPGRQDISNWITALRVLSDHELLIGTGSYCCEGPEKDQPRVGVLVYLDHKGTPLDPADDTVLSYVEPDDMASTSVSTIDVDEKGRLIIANGNYQPLQAAEDYLSRPIRSSLGRISICFLDPGPSWATKADDWVKCY